MVKTAKKVKRLVIYLIVFSLLIFVGMKLVGGHNTDIRKSVSQKFTGEDIYSGVVFGQGDVAKMLPEIRTNKRSSVAKKEKQLSKKILSNMKSKNPMYFDQLKRAVYNKDFVKVDHLLLKGRELMKKTQNEALTSSSESPFLKSDIGLGAGLATVWSFYNITSTVVLLGDNTPNRKLIINEVDNLPRLKREEVIKHLVTGINSTNSK